MRSKDLVLFITHVMWRELCVNMRLHARTSGRRPTTSLYFVAVRIVALPNFHASPNLQLRPMLGEGQLTQLRLQRAESANLRLPQQVKGRSGNGMHLR